MDGMGLKGSSLDRRLDGLESYSEELGLSLKKSEDRFKWFLASFLFGKRISAEIAKTTFQEFEKSGITTPEEILDAGWNKLVEVLDSGGYVRYDFSTASRLLEISEILREKYGSIEGLYESAEDSDDLEKKLAEFKGMGPTTINIFLRELRPVWEKANPEISALAKDVAEKLGLSRESTESYESALVRIGLEYCKSDRCESCPVREDCSKFKG